MYVVTWDTETVVKDWAEPYKARVKHREVVRQGAFTDTLARGDEVVATVDHRETETFSRRSTGELLLQEDSHGLFATCELPRSAIGDKVRANVEAGIYKGCSFRRIYGNEKWTDGPMPFCELLGCTLKDICVTATPQYSGTEAKLRHDEQLQDYFRRLRLAKIR